MNTLMHTLAGLLGVLLLYLALFLKETEDGRLQNTLEELWVRVDDLSRVALTKQLAFLQEVSAFLTAGFDRLFGTRLLSLISVSVSLCFSVATMLLVEIYWLWHFLRFLPIFQRCIIEAVLVIFCGLTFLFGLEARRRPYLGLCWSLVFGALVVDVYSLFFRLLSWNIVRGLLQATFGFAPGGYPRPPLSELLFRPAILLVPVSIGAVICDIWFLAVTRWCLRRASRLDKAVYSGVLLLLNGLAGILLVVVPVILFSKVPNFDVFSALLFVACSNLMDAFVGLVFLATSALAFMHLVLWPTIERPLYSAQRHGLIRKPKLLATAGISALLFAWPQNLIVQAVIALTKGK